MGEASIVCGIAGLLTSNHQDMEAVVAKMNASLVHRGPDDSGLQCLPDDGVALAMRRLSIVDICGGHQPMWDERREHLVVFNGEIYNHDSLRRDLVARGHEFVSHHSDTEVVVHGFEEWGTDLFSRLNGMFALAVWSRRYRKLTLARDRMGEKPLYIAMLPEGFAFASELKAILAHPRVPRMIDFAALDQYLSLGYVIGPRTMLRGVSKLPGGHFAVLCGQSMHQAQYWQPGFTDVSPIRIEEATSRLDQRLDESVRMRMVADVPVGVFLSGGLDSSTVAYYMRRHSDDVHSFSIGFDERDYDESRYAQIAAAAIGTKHHTQIFSDDYVQDVAPRIVEALDDPMPDSSILPTYLLCRFARQGVKVALGGDGSDELLMGYQSYQFLRLAWQLERFLPMAMRRGFSACARVAPWKLGSLRIKGQRLASRLDKPAAERLLALLSVFDGDGRWVLAAQVRAGLTKGALESIGDTLGTSILTADPAQATLEAYVRGYLQEDILVKVDRASMACSLEVRSPFLDPDLVDLLGSLPVDLKLRGSSGKFLLRRLMHGRLPEAILHRKKMGFGVPMARWLRGPLGPFADAYLAPERLRMAGIFDPEAVAILRTKLAAGHDEVSQPIWFLLLFEMWRERWVVNSL